MSQSPATLASQTPTPTTTAGQAPKQDALINFCRSQGMRTPSFQVLSDRRAWSCVVAVGQHSVQARFWYDGQYVNNAREDAAERALQMYGQIPAPPGPQPMHYQHQQRAFYGGTATGTGTGAVGS